MIVTGILTFLGILNLTVSPMTEMGVTAWHLLSLSYNVVAGLPH